MEYDRYSEHTEDIAQKRETKGRAEGLLEGRTEGLLEGRTEGLLEGRTEGLRHTIIIKSSLKWTLSPGHF
jgi:flagellar biosynthesis/type III secretory pathway protein FliH